MGALASMAFITEHFLLDSEAARRLYHEYAEEQPIFDYHCHLPAQEIAENRRFANLFEIWLEGDHYKWRAMRANGVAERFCTGSAPPYEKFMAWARTVPYTVRNALYHWTHLELERYFGIDALLDQATSQQTWKEANRRLLEEDCSAHGILKKFDVRAVCTTDDPTDSLQYHQQIAASSLPTRVFPAFRPDKALKTDDPKAFNQWTDKLSAAANVDVSQLADFLDALEKRHDFFHQQGCRLSDHGLDYCPTDSCMQAEAESIFAKVRSGKNVTAEETAKFASFLMLFFGRLDAKKGWTKQLHLGAARSLNTRMLKTVGRDTGFDSIGDWPQAAPLAKYLDRLNQDQLLPKIIVYNLNPADNYAMATLMGNFPEEGVPGKLQFGSGWWFLDQKEGIEWQLNALSQCGLLSRFVGMTTDSRSFMSYPRHEYFRRVLCNLLGSEMERGQLPQDWTLIGTLVRNVCYGNASAYFQLPSVASSLEPSVVGVRDR
jgi:glucuronate isomerase